MKIECFYERCAEYGMYIIILNKYQRVHYITSTKIEAKLYELISEEKKKVNNNKEILLLFPLMRFIKKLNLLEEKWYEMWFKKALKRQKEKTLENFLTDKLNTDETET